VTARPSVVVYDYGSGNVRSAVRALERAGAAVSLTADRTVATTADGLVIPGVGAFAACVSALRAIGGDDVIAARAAAGRPVLGICVGLQVLFETGTEHGESTAGFGLLAGAITRLPAKRLPHMGWNTVTAVPGSVLFAQAQPAQRYYFVHSYAAGVADDRPGALVTTAEYGVPFVAAIEAGPLCGTQFHPEKSGDAGARLLTRWVGRL
jgi:glutamine amidotransferase